ncbi:hypothetical protein Adu01nite_49600 [Paractinoplanes durhamensis]|uniref:Uncharacterized protein n=1 Tax=Paractinoplanes durhamensis TaxID=113563 RepID=A0ABQ3Z1E3_9ACTN|nr:hypothetical protein Adu01nite_49600 [Actinoplanes durhamensis]
MICLENGRCFPLAQRAVHFVTEGAPDPLRLAGSQAHVVGQDLPLAFAFGLTPGDSRQNPGDHAAGVGSQVDVSGGGGQTDVPLQSKVDQELQVLHRSGYPIEMPRHNEVRSAGLDHLDHSLPARPICKSAGSS